MTDTQRTAVEQIMDEVIVDISHAIGNDKYTEALTKSEVLKNLAIACVPNTTIMNWGKLTHIEAKDDADITLTNEQEN